VGLNNYIMKNVLLPISLFIFTLVLGCKKEECSSPPEVEKDYYLDYTDPILNPFLDNFIVNMQAQTFFRIEVQGFMKNDSDYCCPKFNPNNPYEIAYLVDFPNASKHLFKFNFKTGKSTYLTDNVIDSYDWGSNGWILLWGRNNQIWKIKDNGDSLTQITNSPGINAAPLWSSKCTFFSYYNNGATIITNINTGERKTPNVDYINWVSDSTFTYLDSNYYTYLYNIKNEERVLLRNGSRLFLITNGSMLDFQENNDILSYMGIRTGEYGLGYISKYNYKSAKQDTLRKFYNSYHYSVKSFSQKTNKILATLTTGYPLDSMLPFPKILYDHRILIANADGSDERIVKIPK
jgi:hypothetical protein